MVAKEEYYPEVSVSGGGHAPDFFHSEKVPTLEDESAESREYMTIGPMTDAGYAENDK